MKRRPVLMGNAERVARDIDDPCPTLLTRSVLDRQCNAGPPDNHHSITPRCHPESGVKIWYCRADGCALLVCAGCALAWRGCCSRARNCREAYRQPAARGGAEVLWRVVLDGPRLHQHLPAGHVRLLTSDFREAIMRQAIALQAERDDQFEGTWITARIWIPDSEIDR